MKDIVFAFCVPNTWRIKRADIHKAPREAAERVVHKAAANPLGLRGRFP